MSTTTMVYKLNDTLTIAGIAKDAPIYRTAKGLLWVNLSGVFYPVMYYVCDARPYQINDDKLNQDEHTGSLRDSEVHIGPRPYRAGIQASEFTWTEYEKKKDIDPLELIARLIERVEKLESKVFPL